MNNEEKSKKRKKHSDESEVANLSPFVKRRLALNEAENDISSFFLDTAKSSDSAAVQNSVDNTPLEATSSSVKLDGNQLNNGLTVPGNDKSVPPTNDHREPSTTQMEEYIDCPPADPFLDHEMLETDDELETSSKYIQLLSAAFHLSNHMSKKAFDQHLRILQVATKSCIKENKNAYHFLKKFDYLKTKISKIFVCINKSCSSVLVIGEKGLPIVTQPCGHKYLKTTGSCYILRLPIDQQIRYFLEKGVIERDDFHRFEKGLLGDVNTGAAYREEIAAGKLDNKTITLQLNIDGAQTFKSSKFGIWPLMAVINEARYRTRRSNMLLFALWYGNKKPPRDPFLKYSVDQLNRLEAEGISYGGLLYKVRPLIITVDTIARPILRNSTQFNGEYGCDFCLNPGIMIKKGKGSTRVYPEPPMNPTFPVRSLNQHLEDVNAAQTTKKPCHGVHGPTPLMDLNGFNHVRAQSPDYLHSCCQGAIKFFIELWISPKNHKQPWYLNARKRSILEARLNQVKPPYEVTRITNTISDLAFWKASQFRAFALYYFPLLIDLLPRAYFEHFCDFVYSLQVLLQEEVSEDLVREVEILFQNFVRNAESLYGLENMRFNLHLLTHLTQSVLDWGCLWTTSTFIPEWFNGELISLCNGTQGVVEQMAHSFLIRHSVRSEAISLMSKYVLPKTVTSLFEEMLHIPKNREDDEDVTTIALDFKLLGRGVQCKANLEEEIALRNYILQSSIENLMDIAHDEESIDKYISYPRLKLTNGTIFTTTNYSRSPKRINYCALMSDGQFFFINKVVYFENFPCESRSYVIGHTLGKDLTQKICPNSIGSYTFSNLLGQTAKLVGLSCELMVYNVRDILKKCVVAMNNSLTETFIVTALPNALETD